MSGQFLLRAGVVALWALAIAGCGGGGDGGTTTPAAVKDKIAEAAKVAANDTSTNSLSAFKVLQDAGVAAVTIASPPKVNFTVFSDGAVKQGLTVSNVRFAIAKLVTGTNGDPDRWESYINRTETATASVGPNGAPVLASAKQATTENPGSAQAAQLVYNADGYYTYTFTLDITDPTKTGGVTFEPNRTHRIAIQLSYTNAAGATVRANPYFDFTVDSSGKSVAVTDATKTRKVVDITTCNGCHDNLAFHGGGRIDTQYCVMCHNPGTTDANSGNVLTMSTMTHKIHAGRFLHQQGEDYVIWGFRDSKHDYTEVGFPANVRNCARCHDGSKKDAAGNPLAAQGDNWKKVAAKETCLTCHQTGSTTRWFEVHVTNLKLGTSAADMTNATCASCHGEGKSWSPDKAHFLQELENTKLYEGKIVSATLTTPPTATTAGKLTVKVAVVNPATGSAYNLREGCGGLTGTRTTTDSAGTTIPRCYDSYRWYVNPLSATNQPQDKFGAFQVYLSTNLFEQATDDTTDLSANLHAYRGVVDASNNYTITLNVPAGAKGNARVVMVGSVAERRLDPFTNQPVSAARPTTHEELAYVPVKNAMLEVNLDTGASPSNIARRKIVSNDRCNDCHAVLGIPMKPGFGEHAFHSGVRNNGENCEVCHSWSRAGSYTVMTDGTDFNESWEATRMIHGIHGGTRRTYPFTHGNDLQGVFNKAGFRIEPNDLKPLQSQSGQASEVLNFTTEVAYPGILANCNNCHVNDSWKQNLAVLGNAIVGTSTSVRNGRFTNPGINQLLSSGACVNPTGSIATLDLSCGSIDTSKLPVISPKAAACSACHDSQGARTHMISIGGAIFGGWGGTATKNQGDINAGRVLETCDGCHAPGAFKGIDAAHGLN